VKNKATLINFYIFNLFICATFITIFSQKLFCMNLYSTENGKTQESNEKIYIVDIPVIIGTLIKENGIEKIILESEIGIQEKTISKQEEILEKEIQDKNSIKKRKSEEELKNPSKTKRRKSYRPRLARGLTVVSSPKDCRINY